MGGVCLNWVSPWQQDCQEFLVLLLDCLHEDIINQFPLKSHREKRGGSDNDDQMEESQSVITGTFQGQLKNEVKLCTLLINFIICCILSFISLPLSLFQVTCSVCGHVSVKCDPFVYLSVPIPHSNEQQIS